MEKELKNMIFLTSKLLSNLTDIVSGDYSHQGCSQKLDEIEYFLSELDVNLGKIK